MLVWRSRTAAEESGADEYRGVPTFRRGLEVPARDLHAFGGGQLDESAFEAWLLACLALDWRGVRHQWAGSQRVTLVPILGLLHPLARGLGDQEDASAPKLAMCPDWAVRLAAGQVQSVHADAVRRLRQAGWDAVPPLQAPAADGTRLAAALVPRCSDWRAILNGYFAVRLHTDQHDAGAADMADDAHEQETNPHELAEELS